MVFRQICFVICFLVFSYKLFGQEFYLGLDGCPKAAAMGKTSLVSSNAGSNLFYNPASLADITYKDFQFNFYNKKGKSDHLIQINDNINKEKGNFSGTPKITGISFTMPFRYIKNTTLGIGYQLIRDNQINVSTPSQPNFFHQDGGIKTISVGLGSYVTENLSFGTTINCCTDSKLDSYDVQGSMVLFTSNYKKGPFKLSAKIRSGMDIDIIELDSHLHTPFEYGLGASYLYKSNTFALELDFPNYNDFDFVKNYTNKRGLKFRFGESYKIDKTKSLQFGYFVDDLPSTLGLLKLKGLTFGGELLMNDKLTINIAVEGSKSVDTYHYYDNIGIEHDIEIEMTMYKLLFGLTMRE